MRAAAIALTAALALAGLGGCANVSATKDALLTYESLPEGAVIYEAGQALGPAPVTRTYAHDGKSESIRTPEVTAVWPSGARQTFWTLLPPGADRVATIERPQGAPGLQADLDHARKVAAQRESDAARAKEAQARDLARDSARCRAQAAKGTSPIDDCK
jgi:hypothetical protein